MIALLDRPWAAPLAILALSAGALAAAFIAQYVFGLEPCVLCLYQRWPYGIAIALGLLGLGLAASGRPVSWLMAVAGLVFLANAGIAGFHVGVEQQWWQGTSGCAAPISQAKTLAEMRAQILAAPVIRCDEVAWSLFGISMAGYNIIASVGLAAFSFVMARRARSRQAA